MKDNVRFDQSYGQTVKQLLYYIDIVRIYFVNDIDSAFDRSFL
jgi:hypothetical protein